MRTILFFFAAVLILFSVTSCREKAKTEPASVQKTDISEFIGQWTIDVQGGGVSWLEVRQEKNYLDADLLWIGGSVLPVANVFLLKDQYLMVTRTDNVVRTKDENNVPIRSQVITNWLQIEKQGDKISGFLLNPKRNGLGVDSASFVGTKLPVPPPAPDLASVKYGTPINLFNGKDLTGWKLINEKQKNGFYAKEGIFGY